MLIFIYKIKNLVNDKVYIGQSIRPIEQRFQRHINDAINNNLNTHFARAIRKYGADKFVIEQIDTADSQEELNLKEQYWIRFYNSVSDGYNETDAIYKCGGNTYQSKSEDELLIISSKLSDSKMGSNNPNAKAIKCLNTISGEELVFNTAKQCQEYFQESTHRFITTRVTHRTIGLYKDIWNIAYLDEEYNCVKDVHKTGKKISVQDINTGKTNVFESIRLLSRELGVNRSKINKLSKDNNIFQIDNYIFTILN